MWRAVIQTMVSDFLMAAFALGAAYVKVQGEMLQLLW